MNLLVITDLYPIKDNEKNTPKTIFNFVKEWQKSGHNVNIIIPNFILNSFIRKKPFYKSGMYNDIENLNYWTPFCGNIKHKLQQNYNPDIVIAHMPSGLIFANKLGLPFVAGVHVSDLEVLTNPIYSVYFKSELEKAYKNAIKIACRSEVLKQKFLKLYPQYQDKTFVAFSGIDKQTIAKRKWQNKEKYKILTCARLIKRKNIDKIIQACNKIKNVELTIIGDGSEYKYLSKLAGKNVSFRGFLNHDKVLEEMKNSDIFVLPSKNETFGMVYLEAMASGCITVGLEHDGIDGIIKNNKNGYLCNLDNIFEVLNYIINSNNQNEILENSYNTIINYTEEIAALNYLSNIAE